MNPTNCDAMAALLQEYLDSDFDEPSEEAIAWLDNFEARVKDALTIHRTITERKQ